MEDKQTQSNQPLENVIDNLRDEYISRSPTLTTQEAPKAAKQVRLHPGKPKNFWLILLTILVVLSGMMAAVLLLRLGNRQDTVVGSETRAVVEGNSLENWEDFIDPTLPPTAAVLLPEQTSEPLPVEPTLALPEVTPWPTPPITLP